MKNLVFIFFTLFIITSCGSESSDPVPGGGNEMETDECEGTSFTYSNDIANIVNSNCALAGCHVQGNSEGIPDFTQYQNLFDRRSTISSRVNAGTMPPSTSGITLTDAQKLAITCWVKAGAPQ